MNQHRFLFRCAFALAFFLSSNALGQPCAPLPSGLVSWWRGENSALDAMGGHHGTFANSSFAVGTVGQAFDFTGSQFLQVPDHAALDFTNAFTIELWVSPTVAGHANGTTFMVSKGNMNFVTTQSYGIFFNSSRQVAIRIANGSALGQLASVSALPLNSYSHVAVTYSGSEMRVYVNGVLESSQPTSIGTLLNTSEGLMVGGAEFGGGTKILTQAGMDEVSLYDRALNDTEIAAIFAAGSAGKCVPCVVPPGNLVAWWSYEETNQLIAVDSLGGFQASLTTNGIVIPLGTPVGTTVVAGKVGSARRLSAGETLLAGGGGSLNIPSDQITLEAWLKLENNPTSAPRFTAQIGKQTFPDKQAYQMAFESGSNLGLPANQWLFEYILTRDDGFRAHNRSTGVILTVDEAFHHVALTYDSATVRLYVDGTEEGNFPFSGNLTNVPAEPFAIGGAVPFAVDEVSVYSRALSGAELQAIFNAGSAGKCVPVCAEPPNDLVSWWRAEHTALDSLSGNHGTAQNGAGFTNGEVGQAFNFDGTDDFIDLGFPPNLRPTNGELTIIGWIQFPDPPNNAGVCTARYPILSSAWGYSVEVNNQRHLAFGTYFNIDEGVGVVSPAPLSTNVFHHFAAIHTPTELRLYVDGQLVNTAAVTNGTIYYHPGDTLKIGARDCGPNRHTFKGQVDELAVFGRALTTSEIQSIYTAGSAGQCVPVCATPPPNIVGWWRAENNGEDSIHTNAASLSGGTTFTGGIAGHAFAFDGIDDIAYVTDAAFGAVTNDFAMEMWAFPTAGRGAVSETVISQTGIGTGQRYAVFPPNGDNAFGSGHAGAGLSIGTNGVTVFEHAGFYIPSPLVFDTPLFGWNHLAIVYSNNQPSLYLNGVFARTGLVSPRIVHPSAELGGGVYGFFRGLLDEYAVYSRALSAGEVHALFLAGSAGKCVTGPIAPLAVLPANTNAFVSGAVVFAAAGGAAPYLFSLVTNNSGGSVNPFSGVYVAGPIPNVTDTVRLKDALGSDVFVTINVLPDPTPRPDLAIHEVLASSSAQPGVPFELLWVVTNRGDATANGPWTEQVFLSNDSAIGGDVFLAALSATSSLAAGASVTRTQQFALPADGEAGLLRFVIAADPGGVIHERDEANNHGISSGTTSVPLALTLTPAVASIAEGAGTIGFAVTRNGSRAASLMVNLASSDTTELAVPVSVVIAAGAASATFNATAQADGLFDDAQIVTLSATAGGFANGNAAVTVPDSDVPRLFLSFPRTNLIEGASVTATLTRELVTAAPRVITIAGGGGQLAFPGTVTIGGSAASATFTLSAIPDTLVEGTNAYSVSASASGFLPASALIVVEDDDIPNLTIVLAAHSVSEGAGANAAAGTVRRGVPAPRALTVALFSSNTNAARVPASVIIPAGQTGAVFSVAAVNNLDVDGSKSAVIGGFALETGTGVPLREATPDTLTVTDDDGPTLRLTLARDFVGEGLNPAATATVSRNDGTGGALTVELISSDTTEATLPASVAIPNGTNAVAFTVTSLNDGVMDGNQSVTFTASATSFTPGTATLVVSDADLPDLVISSVTTPTNAVTGQQIDVGFRVENQGIAPAASSFLQRISLSADAQAGEDAVLAQAAFSGSIPVGLFFEQTLRVFLPQTPGNYWLVASADVNNQVSEGLENNNTRVTGLPIAVSKSYAATVVASVETAVAGTPMVLRGHATRTGANTAAVFELVNVHLSVRGMKRILTALTDASGDYSVTFTPLSGEAGFYTVGADHPGVTDTPTQDAFTLIGMRVQPVPPVRVIEGGNATGMTLVENLSNVGLNGLAASVLNGPAGLTLTPSLETSSLSGDGSVVLRLTVDAPLGSQNAGAFRVRLTSTEGAMTEFDVPVSLEILAPRLVVSPSSLSAGMKRGGQASVSFTVTNVGGAATGPLTVLLPPLPWMRVSAGAEVATMAPGSGTEVTLLLTPPGDLTLGDYTGSLAVNASNASVSVPFTFRALSDNIGHLQLTAISELTFYAEGSPNVSNATVRLTDVASGVVVVATTNVGASGVILLTNLLEAFYQVHVEAPDHSPFDATVLLEAARTNTLTAFLSRQTVRYVWTVEPTTIEDVTRITIETIFETAVPIPVVTVEPSLIDLEGFGGTERQVDLKISNHGLIAAQSGRLDFETSPLFTFTPLIQDIGFIPAQSSLTVPVIIRKVSEAGGGGPQAARSAAGGDIRCQITGTLKWSVPCGGMTITHEVKIPVLNLIDRANLSFNCNPTPPPGSGAVCCGGGGVVFPGGGLANPSYGIPIAVSSKPPSCDPCVQKRTKVILIDCPLKFLPLPDLGANLQDAADCYDAAQGLQQVSAQAFAAALYACEKAAIGAFGGDEGGQLGPVFSFAECLYEIITACDGTGGPPPPSGGGLGKFLTSSGPKSSPANDPVIQPLIREVDRLSVVLAPITNLFGSRVWLEPGDAVVRSNWFRAFDMNVATNSDAGLRVSAAERQLLLALALPGTATTNDATSFLDRWNRTFDYYDAGIFDSTTVPAGQSPDFLAADTLANLFRAASGTDDMVRAEGYIDALDAVVRSRDTLIELLSQGSGGVCAKVKLRLDQDAIISRDAFKAMLEIDNGTSDPLEEISVELRVRNEANVETTDLFQIQPAVLNGISGVTGTGILPAQATGSARWIIVPTSLAAPRNPVRHLVSGTLRYRQAGTLITIPLVPTAIDVLPNPRLIVDYFHQRDVFSDDPFTPEIEPAEPFSLAVMVRNDGFGTARNFHIQSAQPRIVENDKGLLVDFQIIATEVAGVGLTPTLTANFGDVTPGQIALGRWLFKSSLQGLFTDYRATFEHVSGLGDRRLSLIDRVSIHEMLHLVQADRAFEDGKPDFLVNEIPDFRDDPDTIYFSNGSNAPVSAVTAATNDGPVTLSHLTVQLGAIVPSGWVYLRVPDPGDANFRLREVRRADNSIVLVNTNVWRTDRTFIGFGQRPLRENILHLLDFDSAGGYTLLYEPAGPTPDTNAPLSAVAVLPAASPESFNVTWSGSDGTNGSGLAFFDIFISVDGGPFTNWLAHATASGAVFNGEPNRTYAFFSRATDAEGNTEAAPGTADAQTSTTIINTAPLLSLGADQALDEGTTLVLAVSATDTDAPPQTLTLALLPGAPPGVSLNSSSGALTFQTSEGTGPSTNFISVRVTDNGVPPLTATSSVTIIVREVNSPPILAAIPWRTINEGSNLVVTATASDLDLPANTLVFALGPNAPAGANITPSGVFSWLPNATQGPSSNRIDVMVTDNGVPPLSATQSFTVMVRDTRADFMLSVGSTNVFAGESNAVSLRLNAGLPLSEVAFDLNASNRALGSFVLGAFAPEVLSASLVPLNDDQSRLRFVLESGAQPDVDRTLAQLGFRSGTNGPSASILLRLAAPAGLLPGGGSVTNAALFHGHVVVVAQEPVLETEGVAAEIIRVFARAGNYRIECAPSLADPVAWQTVTNFAVTGPSLRLALPPPGSATRFYRVVSP